VKKILSTAVAFVLVSTALVAQESPRAARQPRDTKGVSSLTVVFDPEGAAKGAAAPEASHYLVTRQSAKDGVMYAFPSEQARAHFVAKAEKAEKSAETRTENGLGSAVAQLLTCADARFNNTAYATSGGFLVMACGQTNPYLSDDWNDRLSYVEASGSWTILYKCYDFNQYPYNPNGTCSTLAIQGGTTYPDLNVYSFNNITSSIKVCPEGITFSECQSFQ
jgi:hypothetical protein